MVAAGRIHSARSVAVLLLCALATDARAQAVKPPPLSEDVETPAWSHTVNMPGDRVFVTDGGLALDVAIAKPKPLPAVVLGPENAKVLSDYLSTENPTEIGLGEVAAGEKPNTFVGRGGVPMNGNYIAFLRRAAPHARLRLDGPADPILVVVEGRVVGVFMPLKPDPPDHASRRRADRAARRGLD